VSVNCCVCVTDKCYLFDVRYAACTLRASPRGVPTVCFPLDEQSPDARNAIALCHPTVGHVSGTVSHILIVDTFVG